MKYGLLVHPPVLFGCHPVLDRHLDPHQVLRPVRLDLTGNCFVLGTGPGAQPDHLQQQTNSALTALRCGMQITQIIRKRQFCT